MIDLDKLIESLEWEAFQEVNDGNIHVFSANHGLIRFCYRVGLHLKQPMEAIMAKGEYVKFRPGSQYENMHLERLDPENVDKCLYFDCYTAPIDVIAKKLWEPKRPKGIVAMPQSNPAHPYGGLLGQHAVPPPPSPYGQQLGQQSLLGGASQSPQYVSGIYTAQTNTGLFSKFNTGFKTLTGLFHEMGRSGY